jgi:hypothetical protein
MADQPVDASHLIARVDSEVGGDDPLARVAHASHLADELAEAGDQLIDHFVLAAREAGCSWSDIGGSLGVSKQAAQQRFSGAGKWRWPSLPKRRSRRGWFHRFTANARGAVINAQKEARDLNHNYVGTEHLLLALVRGDGVAAKVLSSLGVGGPAVEERIRSIVGTGTEAPGGHIPFTPRAKKVLELSLRESLRLGHKYIGTEHILLGLVREGEGLAMQILHELKVPSEALEPKIITALTGLGGFSSEPPAAS